MVESLLGEDTRQSGVRQQTRPRRQTGLPPAEPAGAEIVQESLTASGSELARISC
jgi:hypothetical protein